MPRPGQYQHPTQQKLSWLAALKLYLRNDDRGGLMRLIKMLSIKIAPWAFPVSAGADIVFLNVRGDNIFWMFFGVLLVRLYFKVRRYREVPPQPPYNPLPGSDPGNQY